MELRLRTRARRHGARVAAVAAVAGFAIVGGAALPAFATEETENITGTESPVDTDAPEETEGDEGDDLGDGDGLGDEDDLGDEGTGDAELGLRSFGPASVPQYTYTVGLYVYQKLDATAPPSWENSGVQTLVATQPFELLYTPEPDDWSVYNGAPSLDGVLVWQDWQRFVSIDWGLTLTDLPFDVCGDDWAYQQDLLVGDADDFPDSVIPPDPGNLRWPPVIAAAHGPLSALIGPVPPCTDPVDDQVSLTTTPPSCASPVNTLTLDIPEGIEVSGYGATVTGPHNGTYVVETEAAALGVPLTYGTAYTVTVTALPGWTYSGPSTLSATFTDPASLNCSPPPPNNGGPDPDPDPEPQPEPEPEPEEETEVLGVREVAQPTAPEPAESAVLGQRTLAFTGVDASALVVTALGMVLVGAGALVTRRKFSEG